MTNVKDRDTLPDIVEFQGFQLLSITKKRAKALFTHYRLPNRVPIT